MGTERRMFTEDGGEDAVSPFVRLEVELAKELTHREGLGAERMRLDCELLAAVGHP